MRSSTTYFTALTLFDTWAYIFCQWGSSEVVEAATRQGTQPQDQQTRQADGDRGLGCHCVKQQYIWYCSLLVNFLLRGYEVGQHLRGITANVIDSCIEVIIELPDIRMHRLIHRIPSYFDTPDPSYLDVQIHSNEKPQEMKSQDKKLSMIANDSSLRIKSTTKCRGSLPCTTCADLSTIVGSPLYSATKST